MEKGHLQDNEEPSDKHEEEEEANSLDWLLRKHTEITPMDTNILMTR